MASLKERTRDSTLLRMRDARVSINSKAFVPQVDLTARESALVLLQYIRCSSGSCASKCDGVEDCLCRLALNRHFVPIAGGHYNSVNPALPMGKMHDLSFSPPRLAKHAKHNLVLNCNIPSC